MKLVRLLLFPISVVYGIVLRARNLAYDYHIFKSYQANIPTICLGNLSMGGTGKTPHTKFLLDKLNVPNTVVLSRGYGRKTKGFLWVNEKSIARDVGDEPLEIKKHKPSTKVAVCESRVIGLKTIQKQFPETKLIILDDAYQHRKLKCSLYILLTTYDNLFFKDYIFPAGYLRDNRKESKRASVTVVTKSPDRIKDKQIIEKKIKNYTNGIISFSRLNYAPNIHSLSGNLVIATSDLKNKKVLLLTGLANPKLFVDYWKLKADVIHHLKFPDHHDFSKKDLTKLRQIFDSFAHQEPIVITSEKDSMRLASHVHLDVLRNVPIFVSKMAISMDDESTFLSIINKHISTFNYVN